MEFIGGNFYMKGCSADDPRCIHNVAEAKRLILEAGFLPLFENGAAGFSVEEHTPAAHWWTGDPETDPWEWRITLSKDPDVAYGKFFDKKAGFISKEWFPDYANYRRDGYDFDALWEDELASYRMKKIMDVFRLDEHMNGAEILSAELKELAGFGKGGEKNFEGVLTDLQMRGYLIMSDFRQRKNKKGVPYGWHLAALSTPETKWGYDHVTSAYRQTSEASFERMLSLSMQSFPEAGESEVIKMLSLGRKKRI